MTAWGVARTNVRDLAQLLAINDPVLAPLIRAEGEEERRGALEEIVVRKVGPIVRSVLSRYRSTNHLLQGDDLEDVTSVAMLRLVRRIQAASTDEGEAIAHLADFAATLTYNTAYDFMRRRFPARTRLKNRVRYVLTRDRRFALFNDARGPACCLTSLPVAPVSAILLTADALRRAAYDREHVAEAIEAVLVAVRHPVLVDDLVKLLAEAWNVVDVIAATVPEAAMPATQSVSVEHRQYLKTLWGEIRELRPPQRTALLYNLRDVDGGNAVALFTLVGVATIDEIAETMGVTTEKLAALWNELPLDDLRIASMLGVTRQQVINFRSAARVRLTRRMRDRS